MSENTIKNIILPQRISSHGVRLDALVDYPALVNLFLSGGLGAGNLIYAADIARLKAHFDSDKDGKFSLEDAKAMGLQGTDNELNVAVGILENIATMELPPQETYPLRITMTESLNYDKDGKLVSRTTMEPTEQGINFAELVFRNGNEQEVIKKYLRKPDGTLHFTEYNEIDLTKIQIEAMVMPSGQKIKRVYSYDQRGKLKSFYETGANYNKTTLFDEYGRMVFVREVMGHLVKRTTNIYHDDKQKMLQEIEGDPKYLKDGIIRKQFIWATDKGRKTDKLISEMNILIDGKAVQVN
jgi:hypothetical protein